MSDEIKRSFRESLAIVLLCLPAMWWHVFSVKVAWLLLVVPALHLPELSWMQTFILTAFGGWVFSSHKHQASETTAQILLQWLLMPGILIIATKLLSYFI